MNLKEAKTAARARGLLVVATPMASASRMRRMQAGIRAAIRAYLALPAEVQPVGQDEPDVLDPGPTAVLPHGVSPGPSPWTTAQQPSTAEELVEYVRQASSASSSTASPERLA